MKTIKWMLHQIKHSQHTSNAQFSINKNIANNNQSLLFSSICKAPNVPKNPSWIILYTNLGVDFLLKKLNAYVKQCKKKLLPLQ